MENQINIASHPYGLGGAMVLTGSMQVAGEFFWFQPLSSSVATIKFSNGTGPLTSTTFTNGVGVYGYISQVTQSSGTSIVYYGAPNIPRYTFGS
jgi:hypothetical protein